MPRRCSRPTEAGSRGWRPLRPVRPPRVGERGVGAVHQDQGARDHATRRPCAYDHAVITSGEHLATGIAQSLAVHLVRTYADETTQEYKGGLTGFRLRKVTDLMVTHLEAEFSLIRLAREADMSEFHFSRAFKRTTGLTPCQYFIDLRLEKARRLLRETNRSIIKIGLDVGYTSPSHFAQIFRREVGISPS
jgi:transcriptional regulator GlxA family with amidase domain